MAAIFESALVGGDRDKARCVRRGEDLPAAARQGFPTGPAGTAPRCLDPVSDLYFQALPSAKGSTAPLGVVGFRPILPRGVCFPAPWPEISGRAVGRYPPGLAAV